MEMELHVKDLMNSRFHVIAFHIREITYFRVLLRKAYF